MKLLAVTITLICVDMILSTNELNVFQKPLKVCSTDPMTGFYRKGYCVTGPDDKGTHVACSKVTTAFLEHSKSVGNDLSTPQIGFPGLKDGDHWCLCAIRWAHALKAGLAPPLILEASSKHLLEYGVSMATLKKHAVGNEKRSIMFHDDDIMK